MESIILGSIIMSIGSFMVGYGVRSTKADKRDRENLDEINKRVQVIKNLPKSMREIDIIEANGMLLVLDVWMKEIEANQ